jgi:hypothetical protein
MSLQESTASVVEYSDAQSRSNSDLHGRWLFIARMGWIALTLLILALNVLAIPNYYFLTQAVCRPGALCISGLTQVEIHQLQQLGLSPKFMTIYQIG